MHDGDFYDCVGPLVAGLMYTHIHTHMLVCTNMTKNARRGVADSRGERWPGGGFYIFQFMRATLRI